METSAHTKGRDLFPSTRWSLVVATEDDQSKVAANALEELCQVYWRPVYVFVLHKTGDQHRAQDLTQAFFEKLLVDQLISRADPARGRFRAFLLTSLKNFMASKLRKALTQKRGGGAIVLSMDFDSVDSRRAWQPASKESPEQAYDRLWAYSLLENVLGRLKQEYTAAGKQEQFDALSDYLTADGPEAEHAETARRLGISVEASRAAVYRIRKRYRDLLYDEVAQTLNNPDQADEEMRTLFGAFQK